MSKSPAFPNGHFYSPIVDTDEIAREQQRIWPASPELPGLDMNDGGHRELLERDFLQFMPDYDYPETLPAGVEDGSSFYTRNSQFSWLDSRSLFVLLRAWAPRRVIEVGSGYSSLLMADVNRRFFNGSCEITCIEPYPRPFLAAGVPGISRLIVKRVQEVPIADFLSLTAGDVLFIDSSHVAKTGSDVNYLFLEILPRLSRGVRIHIHDIFLPHDYPVAWVIKENRSWNEQYLVRALLMYSSGFRVLFGCSYAFARFPDLVRAALSHPKGKAFAGGSLWIEKIV